MELYVILHGIILTILGKLLKFKYVCFLKIIFSSWLPLCSFYWGSKQFQLFSYHRGLDNPKMGKKMWDSEPRAGKSSEKWVKSREMSQISEWKDFQRELWVLEVTYHFILKLEL